MKEIQATGVKSNAKKWVLGEKNLEAIHALNQLLNNSLLDLQTAIQAEETERGEARIMETATATVNAIAEAERLRLMEQIRLCVQCGQEYRETVNAEGSCKVLFMIPSS